MSRKSFIDSVEVKSPCTEDWEKMHGNDRVRFCSHCAKSVNNLSEMTRKEAARMVRASGGSLCIRYIKHPATHRPLFADQLIQLTRRAPGLTASVMSASMALSTHAYAQGGTAPKPTPEPPAIERVEKTHERENEHGDTKTTTVTAIRGTINDAAGAVVPNMPIFVVNQLTNARLETASNDEGRYEFVGLEPGKWDLTVAASSGFVETRIVNIAVSEGRESPVNVELSAMSTFVTVGISAMVEYSSPLSAAIADEDVELVRELIMHGAKVNEKEDGFGKITPLFVAIEGGNIEIVRMLLDFGAKVNVRDNSKQTPLMRLDGDATPELVELLIRHGAKMNKNDDEGTTPLLRAVQNSAKPEVLKALIDAGVDVNAANDEGETALMRAAYDDSLESVRVLLMAHAKVNLKNKEGDTAWELTSETEIEELLESHGAEPTKKDSAAEATAADK